VGERSRTPGARGAHDPAVVLGAVLRAVGTTGVDAVAVLRPVPSPDGGVDDFEIVAETGVLARFAGVPSVGRSVRELLPTDFADNMVAASGAVHLSGQVSRGDLFLAVTAAGVVPVLNPHSEDVRIAEVVRVPVDGLVVVLGRDVTEARAAQRAREASEARYRRLVEHSSDPILVVSADGVIRYASPAVRTVVHQEPDALVGRRVCAISHPDDAMRCAELLDDAVHAGPGASRVAQIRTRDDDGHVGWVSVTATNWLSDDAVGGVVLNIRDVTEQRAAEERLQREALQDSLTGLPNRRWFMRALTEAAARGERTGAPYAVLVLDVDGFKGVNDASGHPAGDDLLAQLAARLTTALRPSDTAARLGGDEFVVIAQDLHDRADAATVGDRILERCSGTYTVGGTPTRVTVSVGVAVSADPVDVVDAGGPAAAGAAPDGQAAGDAPAHVDPDAVFRRADAALYEAKRRGRNRVHVGA
jgi:diguanylate cyclase (GGDEF)-like protein/PAS domain S-box-containing protein